MQLDLYALLCRLTDFQRSGGFLLTYLTYAVLALDGSQATTTSLHAILSCAAASIFLQLYLNASVPIFARSPDVFFYLSVSVAL